MNVSQFSLFMRGLARDLFASALAEASVAQAFARRLTREGEMLWIGEARAAASDAMPDVSHRELIDLREFKQVFVVSIGKAGHAMAEALLQHIGSLPNAAISGIIADPNSPASPLDGFRYFRGGHPTPNLESVAAAATILHEFNSLDERTLVIFLISGGGSSVVELPISTSGFPEISLADLMETYRALVLSGAPIEEINAVRKHLSAIKGGRLAQAAHRAGVAKQVSLLVSDVPDDALDALASGPTLPDRSTIADVYRIAKEYALLPQLPESVRVLFEQKSLHETPKAGDEFFADASWHTVLSNETARDGAASAAREAGFNVVLDNSCDDWEYLRAADYLLERLRELRKQHPRVCLISGGEVTVKVSGDCGVGGRNQQFVLACAEKIAGENICVLSAGTDGIDGNSPAAGAVVDGTTLSRAQVHGLSTYEVHDALARFNAYPLFATLGDAITTGPTGNNVRDIRILLAW